MAKWDLVSLEVKEDPDDANGSFLYIVFDGDCTGTFAPQMDGSNNTKLLLRPSAKLVGTITSDSYDNATPPNLTTLGRAAYGTKVARIFGSTPAGSDSFPNVSYSGGTGHTTIVVPLSECLCVGDTMTVSIAANTFTSGGTGNGTISNHSVTNSSAMAHVAPKISFYRNWNRDRIAGNTMTLRFISESRFDTQVIETICTGTGGHIETDYCVLGGRVAFTACVSGKIVSGYEIQVDMSTFVQSEDVVVTALGYPRVGGTGAIWKSQDYTDAGDLQILMRRNITVVCDKNDTLPRYAIVDPIAGNDTTGRSATTVASARLTPYATIKNAYYDIPAHSIRASNVYVKSDCDYTTYGLDVDYGWPAVLAKDPTTSGEVIITLPTGFPVGLNHYWEVRNLTVHSTTNQAYFQGNDDGTNLWKYVGCKFTTAAGLANSHGASAEANFFIDCTAADADVSPRIRLNGSELARFYVDGCDFTFGSSTGTASCFGIVGCKFTTCGNTGINGGAFIAFSDFWKHQNGVNIPCGVAARSAVFCTLIEGTGSDAALTLFGTDEPGDVYDDFSVTHCTFTGRRNIFGYNWQLSVLRHTRFWERHNIYGTVPGGQESRNTKGDSWTTADATRVGNTHVMNGVGCRNCLLQATQSGEHGDYRGIGFQLDVSAGFVDDQSGVSAAGNGDYSLDVGSPMLATIGTDDIYGLQYADSNGVVIRTDGTGDGGAFQTEVTDPPDISYSGSPFSKHKGDAISAINATNAGGAGTFTVFSGSLPTGLSLNSGTGQITGTPTVEQVATDVTIRCTNGAGTSDATINFTIYVNVPAISYAGSPYTNATGDSLNATVTNTGDTGTFTLIAGSLPTGASLNSSTGAITGTLSAVGTFTPTIRCTNNAGHSDTTPTFNVTIAAPNISYTTPQNVNIRDVANMSAVNAGGASTAWTLQSGTMPAGLSLNATTGAITGTYSGVATYTPTIRATNAGGHSDFAITFNVSNIAPVFTFGDRVVYKDAPQAIDPIHTGGALASASIHAGTLPTGMSLDTDGTATGTIGRIYGTPTTVQTKTGISIRGTNAIGTYDSPAFSIDVQLQPTGSGTEAPMVGRVALVTIRPVAEGTETANPAFHIGGFI